MAQLLECPVCHNPVASDAPSCQRCGTREKPLSRLMVAFFVIVSLVLVASWLFPNLFYDGGSFGTRPGHASQQDATRGRDARR
jgi:predicted nucleic acid-binding Zn ribbon protein